MRIGTRLAATYDQHFAELGITQSQFRILVAVRREGGIEGIAPSLLADYLLIERGTISVLTDRMVERGWLMRGPGANRRTYRLVLTEAGAQVLEETIPHAKALADHTLSGLSFDQLREMRTNLETIEALLREGHQLDE